MQTIQSDRKIRNRTKCNQRCKGSQSRTASERSPGSLTHAFLKAKFKPITVGKKLLKNWACNEAHFIQSLRNLETVYGFTPMDMPLGSYPVNVKLAFEAIKHKVEKVTPYEPVFLVKNRRYHYCLATISQFDTGHMLYYLPLHSLWKILHNRKMKKEAKLLTSVCCYLFQIAQIPSYTQGGGVSGIYTLHEEWIKMDEEDFDPDTVDSAISDLTGAWYFGRKLHRSLNHPYHVDAWGQRLNRFHSKTKFGLELLQVAKKMYALYRKYPQRKFNDHFQTEILSNNDTDDYLWADQYISFVWKCNGWLADQTEQYVSEQWGNCNGVDQPLCLKLYNRLPVKPTNLDFEKRLFVLLDELATLLYKI